MLGEIAVGIVPAERDGSVGGRREDVIAMPRGRENVLVGLELDHLHLGLVLQRESAIERDFFVLGAEISAETDIVLIDGELENERMAALEGDGILEVRLAENRFGQLLVPQNRALVERERR